MLGPGAGGGEEVKRLMVWRCRWEFCHGGLYGTCCGVGFNSVGNWESQSIMIGSIF